MQEKTRKSSGADERTPSIPQYFSWVNNTNEGSTEAQTLINLDYFRWLYDTYGMHIRIYAWDAGNLDGAWGTYGFPGVTEKLTRQFPHGYGPLAEKAAEMGCHLGIWGGADGFGDTPEEEKKRFDLIVSLCRDLGFMLFKFDTVCGALRAEKREVFHRMIDTCRKYVPDLVVLNHRNDLGEAEICATTFLWGGVETYIDVHIRNSTTGLHHRVCTLQRGLVPGMKRLTEDHGVCLSSCLDYFEDDLVNQAFARSLILAPEIYGNPWFLRDDEQARLAKIYNLHAKYRDILVEGIALPEIYGGNAVSRGNGSTRLLVLNNPGWTPLSIPVALGQEIGLTENRTYTVTTLHPYEEYIGDYAYEKQVMIRVEPGRAALILIQDAEIFRKENYVLTGCRYETVYGRGAVPDKVKIYASDGEIGSLGICRPAVTRTEPADNTIRPPVLLGTMTDCPLPEETEALYEATCFAADCDSLEAKSRKRSGETAVPQVQKARDAFFAQDTYRYRGTEACAMFDDDPDTFFDGESFYYGTRLNGGTLRVDFGRTIDAARVEIECFEIDTPIREVQPQRYPAAGTASADLFRWQPATLAEVITVCGSCEAPVVMQSVHNITWQKGKRKKAVYTVGAPMRYFRLPRPMDRIYSFRLYDAAGNRIFLTGSRGNNMLSPFADIGFRYAKAVTVTLPEDMQPGMYLSAAINGRHGAEGVYCAAMTENGPIGCPDRASGFPVNHWEHIVEPSGSGYTYYMPVTPDMAGQEITMYALFREECETVCDLWLCDTNHKKPICEIPLCRRGEIT